jgi:hypothetical protein
MTPAATTAATSAARRGSPAPAPTATSVPGASGAGLGGAAYGGNTGEGGDQSCRGSGGAGADSDGWSQLTAGPVQPPGQHLCPRGPIATGLGPDWIEERDVVQAGLERAEGADTQRAGPIRAAGQECVVGSEWFADPSHASDQGNGIFRSLLGPYRRDVTDRGEILLHTMDPTITYETINCPCVKNGVRSNTRYAALGMILAPPVTGGPD